MSIRFYIIENGKSIFTNRKIIINIYINLWIILGLDLRSIKEVKMLFKKHFEIKDEREVRVLLGIQIQ